MKNLLLKEDKIPKTMFKKHTFLKTSNLQKSKILKDNKWRKNSEIYANFKKHNYKNFECDIKN